MLDRPRDPALGELQAQRLEPRLEASEPIDLVVPQRQFAPEELDEARWKSPDAQVRDAVREMVLAVSGFTALELGVER